MNKIWPLLFLLVCLAHQPAKAQQLSNEITNRAWDAQWIAPPNTALKEFGVFHFRKTFTKPSGVDSFVVHVSADNRYKLYVNGQYVGNGPARGELDHWRFETYDLSSYLQPGKNVIAAVVWNFGSQAPLAQFSHQTGFIVQGNSSVSSRVNTDTTWKVYNDEGYKPIPTSRTGLNTYIVVGPGEQIDGTTHPWGWKEAGFDGRSWNRAAATGQGIPRGVGTEFTRMLVPRTIPQMERKALRMQNIRRSSGIKVEKYLLQGDNTITVPPNTKCSFLIDQGYLTTAYPVVKVSGGMDSRIRLTYSEALYNEENRKGNRDVVDSKTMKGYYDIILPEGGENRRYEILWFRTYRYVKVSIETGDHPLKLHDIYGLFTAYPFEEKAEFSAGDSRKDLKEIWDTGWRTARLCAFETYVDCPYYEQLQYVGDTRIQALISLYVSGDDRLMRKAITNFDNSRLPTGLTQSRYPSSVKQVIPPYSLFWVAMVYDYWMHRDDPEFVQDKLLGIRTVLHWFEQRIDKETGMLGPLSWWNFVDWADPWPWDNEKRMGGVPKGVHDGNSSILTLQYAYVLQMASDIFREYGKPYFATKYDSLATNLVEGTFEHCWDQNRNLISDTPDNETFSQHANVMAVLTGMFDPNRSQAVMKRVLQDTSLTQCTFYYSFYINRALQSAGMADRYLETLGPWQTMLDRGLTTFAEKPDPTRSDCHAWSASPNYELLATVGGIQPAAPGFKRVKIAPEPGSLEQVSLKMPHPNGLIEMELKTVGKRGIKGTVILPPDLTGEFVWNGKSESLQSGRQKVYMK